MPAVEINRQFALALERIASGRGNLFITGKAGTGKSTLLEYYREHAAETPVILAPTGVAALNVGGETVHRFFGFGIDVTPEKVRSSRRRPRYPGIYKKLRTVIIDEASMLRADLLDCVDMFLRKHGPNPVAPFGGVQIVFVGDLYQLPPVVTGGEREIFRSIYETPYFFSAGALADSDLEIIELEKVYRQEDAEFVALLNSVRNDSVDDAGVAHLNARVDPAFEPPDDVFAITLTTTNRNADRVNGDRLASLPGRGSTSIAEISGEFGREHYPTATELAFKPGAQIMMLNNDSVDRWVNGSLGVIESVAAWEEGRQGVKIRLRGEAGAVHVEPHTWEVIRFVLQSGEITSESVGRFTQLPFRLAWAVTIHKSQGKTFDNVVIDLERGAFAAGQTYVALSRCTSFEGIVLRRPVRRSSIRADWRIQKFLTGYRYREAEQAMPASEKAVLIRRAIEDGAEIEMTYLKADDTRSERLVLPLSVGRQSYGGRSFLGMRAFCRMRGEERMFRVDRILALETR
ncbi:MAG: AAA family ATPase [Gammaproteobacteria bacterium]|nr:AAA family ATPase [Gammaproteobacteria bacterium]MDE0226779.1 AAA family ATPase [Gammaproteobacteria bacterium]